MQKLVLKIITKNEKYKQEDNFENFQKVIDNGEEYSFDGVNQNVVSFLKENSNDIVDNSDSNIAIEYHGDKFSIIVDEKNPAFSYKNISISVIK